MEYPSLRLKKNEDRRIRGGHPWVYSNEIDNQATPLNAVVPGQLVVIETHQGKALGLSTVNPHALICARLLSHNPKTMIDATFFEQRISAALALRDRLFQKPFYRLIFGDSDGLSGLVIDRFNDVLVVQITTAGMEQLLPLINLALQKIIKPSAILLRNDSSMRTAEHLPEIITPLFGEPPQQVLVEENQVKFHTNIWTGQKTGWFYDHRINRATLCQLVKNKRVLDVFSYIGGWSIQAAVAGASAVHCIDSSATALAQLNENAHLNHVADKTTTIQDDAFKALTALKNAHEKFDVIILDPPAFIKRRKDLKEGLIAYHRLNDLALQLLAPDSILISASCSMHLEHAALIDILRSVSHQRGKHLQIISQGHQGPDHPVHPAIPETDYLKAIFARVF